LLLTAGVDAIWAHVDRLNTHLATGLQELGATVLSDRGDGRSAIVTFSVPDHDPGQLATDLAAEGFMCGARGGGVRVSPHGYNTIDEIDALMTAVRALTT
jgi:selenocysteine lyase/cysteine desulfurase